MTEQTIDPSFIIDLKRDAVASSKEGEDAIMSGIVQALRGAPLHFDSGRVVEPVPIKIKGDKLFRIDGTEVNDLLVATSLAYADSVSIPRLVDETQFVKVQVKVSWEEPDEVDKGVMAKLKEEQLAKFGLTQEEINAVMNLNRDDVPDSANPTKLESTIAGASIQKASPSGLIPVRFSKMCDEFVERYEVIKTKTSYRREFQRFIEVYGDVLSTDITRLMISGYRKLLAQLPSNVNTKKAYRDLTR